MLIKRRNSTGRLNKKKTDNTATASLKRSNSAPTILKRKKPLVALKKGMLKNLVPKKLTNSIGNNVRKDIFLLESPDKSYDSVFWRDNNGSKMLLTLQQNNGQETSRNVLNDLQQVLQNTDQTILSQDNKLPTTLIISTSNDKVEDAKQLAKQIVDGHNANNVNGKQFKVDQILEKGLGNNEIGLTISITETNINQLRQSGFEDLDSEDIIIQPKNFQNDDNLDEQELAIQVSSDSSDDDSSQEDTTEQDTRLQKNENLAPVIMRVEQFKEATKERHFGRDQDRSTEYNNLIASLEAYHKDFHQSLQNYNKILKDHELEATKAKEKITKIGNERSNLVKEVDNLQKEISDNEKAIQIKQSRLENKRINLDSQKEQLVKLNEIRIKLNQPTDEESRLKNEAELEENKILIEKKKTLINSKQKALKKESIELMVSMIDSTDEIEELNKDIDSKNIEIKKVEETLKKEIKETEDTIQGYADQLNNDTKENVIKAAKTYLDSKKIARKDDKIKAVESLINQASDPTLFKDLSKQVFNIDYNNQLLNPLKKLNTGTASEVFLVETKGNIEDSKTTKGYAKKAMKANVLGNDTTALLGFGDNGQKLENDPNLIARQVMSYRVAKAFGSNLIAPEVFSNDFDGTTIGITAEINNATQAMRNVVENGETIQEHTRFDFSKAKTQKDLSDLQIIDAINGQLDRHLGNVFINKKTGEVVTIDQDISHPHESEYPAPHQLRNQFERNTDGKLIYKQQYVDAGSAEKIIAMKPENLRKILEGNPNDPERIDQVAIDYTIERFIAVKEQVIKLKQERKLVSKWNSKTYKNAVDNGKIVKKSGVILHTNYMARAVTEFEAANNNPAKRQGN